MPDTRNLLKKTLFCDETNKYQQADKYLFYERPIESDI